MPYRMTVAAPFLLVTLLDRIDLGDQERIVQEVREHRVRLGKRLQVLMVIPAEFSIPGPELRTKANAAITTMLGDSCESVSVIPQARGLVGELTRTTLRALIQQLPSAARARVFVENSVDAAVLRLVRSSSRTAREVLVELGLE